MAWYSQAGVIPPLTAIQNFLSFLHPLHVGEGDDDDDNGCGDDEFDDDNIRDTSSFSYFASGYSTGSHSAAVSSMRSATSRSGSTLVGESIRHPPGMRPSPQVVAAVALAAANAQVGAVPLPPFSYTDMSPIDPKQRPFPKLWPCRINPPLWRCLINQALWCRINQALRRQMSCQCRTPPVFPNVADVQFAVPRRNQI
jgi:hypothetical protein